MTLEHRTTVTDAAGRLDDDGENWTITLVDPRRTAYGIQRVHEVDPRRVPMHVLEAVMVWAHAGLNPDIDDATDPPTEDIVDAEIVEEAGFYCVACGHDAHAPGQCNTLVEVTTDAGTSMDACRCSVMQEAPRS
ncbi:hypothetical protein QLQ75_gp47 [Gordonia phage Santhid]|uniref:Uncharacterized protein n=1 Tax=Gordonia phage Santhid TaxID=2927281 RepID=A0AAE9GSU0_9CAUD|nr:hypothetical protein QLQ75_gp47 [Gordonia phage Santhid]UOK18041.1 hypothetical protein SEA_SANTHID_47 [Gordonia phage Santhid]